MIRIKKYFYILQRSYHFGQKDAFNDNLEKRFAAENTQKHVCCFSVISIRPKQNLVFLSFTFITRPVLNLVDTELDLRQGSDLCTVRFQHYSRCSETGSSKVDKQGTLGLHSDSWFQLVLSFFHPISNVFVGHIDLNIHVYLMRSSCFSERQI